MREPRKVSAPLAVVAAILLALPACASGPALPKGGRDLLTTESLAGSYLRGRYAAGAQAYDEAAIAYDAAAQHGDVPEATANAFRFALASGDIDLAARHAAKLLEPRPAVVIDADADGAEVVDDLALAPMVPGGASSREQSPVTAFLDADLPRLTLMAQAVSRRDMDKARAVVAEPMLSPLGEAITYLADGWLTYDAAGIEAAAAELRDVSETTYTGFSALHLGMMLDLAGETGAADAAYREALQAGAQDLAVVAIAGLLERSPDRGQAITFHRKLTEDRGYLRRLGRFGLVRLGEPLEGETAAFQRVAKRAPNRLVESPADGIAVVFLNFAWSAYEQSIDRVTAAEEAGFRGLPVSLDMPLSLAQLALAVDPDLASAHYLVASIAAYHEHHADAAKSAGRVSPSSWLYNFAVIDLAASTDALGDPAGAIELLERYMAEDALAPEVAVELGRRRVDAGDTDGALAALTKAIELADTLSSETTRNDNLWRYYFERAAVAAEAGQWPAAEADLRTALSQSPEQPIVLNYLGYSYVERGERLDEAFGMIERALAAMPTSGSITDSLGWAYYQRGDYPKAVEYLERAVELDPANAVISDHLGDAYWQAGRQLEARFEWRHASRLEDADDELKAVIARKLSGEPPMPGKIAATAP